MPVQQWFFRSTVVTLVVAATSLFLALALRPYVGQTAAEIIGVGPTVVVSVVCFALRYFRIW